MNKFEKYIYMYKDWYIKGGADKGQVEAFVTEFLESSKDWHDTMENLLFKTLKKFPELEDKFWEWTK